MPVILSDIFGDPNVGIFSFANDNIAILPAGLSHKKISSFHDTLGVEPCSIGIADSRLVGIYVAGNSNAILVPYITTDDELKQLRSTGVHIEILREKRTALGNIILCNDHGAIVDPRLQHNTVTALEQTLDVPVRPSTIGGLPHVGALATASNKGVLVNPIITDNESKTISSVLGVPVSKGTINSGVPYPKAGLVVNSRGAIVGSHTLGSELITLSNAFQTD
ncbi:MAG TPA: translation initiation factor IF-6 [Candidatus Sulfotelmatobacter sp.]|nr:translation initiation factor IF-6 [Candidatus Sulfotelmatobacter sp.]